MCGRYHLNKLPKDIREHFPPDWEWRFDGELVPRYNIAPGTDCLVAYQPHDTETAAFTAMRWRYYQQWMVAKKHNPHPNAKSETMFTNGMFRFAAHEQRCLVVCDGFYEPKGQAGGYRPWHRFHFEDDRVFALGAIWTRYESEGECFNGFAIATTSPNAQVRSVHNRMPVILETPEQYELWLHGNVEQVKQLCAPTDMPHLLSYRVKDYARNARNEGVSCFDAAEEDDTSEHPDTQQSLPF